jgi:hypothetical protein
LEGLTSDDNQLKKDMDSIVIGILSLAALVFVFWLIRALILWYWGVIDTHEKMDKQIQLLENIYAKLDAIHGSQKNKVLQSGSKVEL